MALQISMLSLLCGAVAAASPSVTLDAGVIQGSKCANSDAAVFYKGIPYAEPPIGSLRFEPPKPYGKYPSGHLNATAPAPVCIQFDNGFVAQGTKSEDCLFLDIWTPSNATKESQLPVKVFVYGGSNTDGGIGDSLYDGCHIAEDGAILVSINYRLGPLGFLALEAAGIYGNQGIQDVLLGLEWVQRSIAEFGGNPKKVLLFGQSAGATDVYAIATLPQAPQLFNSAIAESIALPSLLTNSTLQEAGASYSKQLNCKGSDKQCLQSKSVRDLQSAYSSDPFLNTGLGSADIGIDNAHGHKFWPYVDGKIIAENPLKQGARVPMIFGHTQREGIMDTLSKYNSEEARKTATLTAYTKFLRDNFGPAASTVEKYYPLSLFNSTPIPVIAAIATVVTDAEFKCSGYAGALSTSRAGVKTWMYEFTHTSKCVWLASMPQAFAEVFGPAHTAELPYVFGNLHFDFANRNESCTGTQEEWDMSRQVMHLWTAMAEDASPFTGDLQWPEFRPSANGTTPGMVFANSSVPGVIDFSACELWAKVFDELAAGNDTDSTGAPKPTTPPQNTGSLAEIPLSAVAALMIAATILI